MVCYPAKRPRMRQWLHLRLERTFGSRRKLVAATDIASLVGECSPREVLAQAKSRFRCIGLDELSVQDISDNRPNEVLYGLTDPCTFGHCDAFISHAWSDDGAAKWAAMQSWRSAFMSVNKREPRIWFDKCCIEQSSIDTYLRALPIFLYGCRKLVLLCGTNYLSRLWCLMELCTYVHVGSRLEDIELVLVLKEGSQEEDRRAIEFAFETFDARLCTCFDAVDRVRILSVIDTTFGSLDGFNEAVRPILRAAGVATVNIGEVSI